MSHVHGAVNDPADATAMSGARGPLVVSAVKPRYFSIAGADRDVVYLTGSHFNKAGFSFRRRASRLPA